MGNAEIMRLGALLVALAHASCMEMRETVERMVMVRTTGSDLQPAATGYIYKKDGDGPEIKIKMEADEVMEHLSKYYKQPEAFAAPIPAADGPFYAKEDENKAASYTKEHVIPVEEKTDEHDDHIDGIANEDYDKIFEGYGFGKYNDDFADYLRDLGYFKHGLYHEKNEGKEHGYRGHHDYGDKGYKGYADGHKYDKGGTGDYHTEKYASYSVSRKGGHKKSYDGADAHGKHYAKGDGYKGVDHGHKASHNKGEEVDGFRNVYNKDEFKKDNDFYDGEKQEGGFHKYGDGHSHGRSDAGGHEKGGAHESKHDEGSSGKSGVVKEGSGEEHGHAHSKEEGGESSHHHEGGIGAKGGKFGGKSYGYEVKH